MMDKIIALLIGGLSTYILLFSSEPLDAAALLANCFIFFFLGLGAKILIDIILYGKVKQ